MHVTNFQFPEDDFSLSEPELVNAKTVFSLSLILRFATVSVM